MNISKIINCHIKFSSFTEEHQINSKIENSRILLTIGQEEMEIDLEMTNELIGIISIIRDQLKSNIPEKTERS